MVLSAPRSGSSAVAGALHNMGVNMGTGHLQQGNRWNERGYFEDLRWQKLNKQLTGERYGTNQPDRISERQAVQYRALARECNRQQIWGMKDPRLCYTASFIIPYLEDARMVVVHRSRMVAAVSLHLHSLENYGGQFALTLQQAQGLIDQWIEARERQVAAFRGKVFWLRYENLEDDLPSLGDFAFGGTSVLYDLDAARRFVDKGLDHHG